MIDWQKKSPPNPKALIKWGDIVKLVQQSNLQQAEEIKRQQNQRKKTYKQELDLQVQENRKNTVLTKNLQLRERTQLDQKTREESMNEALTKKIKLKTEQKYQAQNSQLSLIKTRNVLKKQNYGENPFVLALVDHEDARQKQTKVNFKLQNKLNNIQIAIHEQNETNMKIEAARNRVRQAKFREQLIQRQQKQRQKARRKFMGMKKWESQRIPSNESSLQRRYVSFLDYQISQEKSRKNKQKYFLDEEESRINLKALIPDSSPAYLGRIPCYSDRQKQMSIVDHKLSNRFDFKMRASSEINRSVDMSSKISKNQLPQLKKSTKQQQNISPDPNRWKINNPFASQIRKQTISNQKQYSFKPNERRQYMKYDFISGSHRTIMI